MSAADVLMAVGAVGAIIPVAKQRSMSRSMIVAHGSMAALMTVMTVTHVPQWIYLIAALGLFGQAFHMVGCTAGRRTKRLCTIDLTAMGALLLSMPSGGISQAATGHHHGGSGAELPWGPAIVLVCWLLATTLAAASDRRPTTRGALIGSVLMIVGMTPMAI